MGKYDPLREHLSLHGGQSITMSFGEIEKVLGNTLPKSAWDHQAWWANSRFTHVHAEAWLDAGYRVDSVDQVKGVVRLAKC
jgi:hypothetical protein